MINVYDSKIIKFSIHNPSNYGCRCLTLFDSGYTLVGDNEVTCKGGNNFDGTTSCVKVGSGTTG